MWRPVADVGCLPQSLSNLYFESKSHQIQSLLIWLTSLTSSLQGFSFFFPEGWGYRQPHTYLALRRIGHPHSGLHICLAHALPTEFSPRLFFSIVTQHWGAYLLHWSSLWVCTLFSLQWNLHVDQPVKKNQYQNFIGHQLCDLPLHFTNMPLTCL